MRPLIICIVGESGAGKSMIASFIEDAMGIPTLRSYTERPKRDDKDTGHTFVTKEEFNEFKKTDMIAYTMWSGNRYCCLKSDVKDKQTYVIDEDGYRMLLQVYGDEYDIISLRLIRPYKDRLKSVGKQRVSRDKDRFTMQLSEFDYLLDNYHNDKDRFMKDAETLVRLMLWKRENNL